MSRPQRLSLHGWRVRAVSNSPIARACAPVASSALDPVLLSLESKVVEPSSLGHQRGLVGEVGKSRPTPKRQRVVERADRDLGVDGEGLLCVPQRASNRAASSSEESSLRR